MASKIPSLCSTPQHTQMSQLKLAQPTRTMKRQLSGEAPTSVAKKQLVSTRSTQNKSYEHFGKKIMPPPSSSRAPLKTLRRSVSMASIPKNPKVGVSGPRNTVTPMGRPSNVTAATVQKIKPTTGKSRRPAWDLKGRLQDMEEVLKENSAKICNYDSRMAYLEAEKTSLQENLVETKTYSQTAQKEIDELESELRNEKSDRVKEKSELTKKIKELDLQRSCLESQVNKLELELSSKTAEATGLKATVSELMSFKAGIEAQFMATKLQLEEKIKSVSELEAEVNAQNKTILEMTEKIMEGEMTRRRLHNEVQELKGNIQVYCRIRPLVDAEVTKNGGSDDIYHMNFLDENSLELTKGDNMEGSSVSSGMRSRNAYHFSFDRVFTPTDSQEVVYSEISQLVQSALDGYNVCVFAYGQTGSGKTFTMEGVYNDEALEGMIPRTIKHIFKAIEELKHKGWEYQAKVSFLEIYNETIRDLLASPRDTQNKHCEIRLMDGKKPDIYVSNLKVLSVNDESQIYDLLGVAQQHRAVAATKMNDRSSRSHSVFQLKLTGKNSKTSAACEGLLNLVDLAGSERLKESGSEGMRLTETQSINKSLANLGNVIMALAQKQKHIPYRNSKLTHLLQNSLGGNSKTLMFVNVSPLESCFNESLNSLRFATKVNECHIGTAVKQVKK